MNQAQLEEYDDFNTGAADTANGILEALQKHGRIGEITRGLIPFLMNRILRSIESLTFLFRRNPNQAEMNGASILRTIYDTHLQVLYILKDPEPRAKLYLDFLYVEARKMRQVVNSHPAQFFKMLADRNAKHEATNEAAFRRVEAGYRKSSNSYRQNWYVGTLADVAKDGDYEAEYRVISVVLNPIVHSSASGLMTPQHKGRNLITTAWDLLFRCLGKTAECEGILSKRDPETVESVLKPTYKPIYEVSDEVLEAIRKDMSDSDDDAS
jgi:uncharacterized protein DUF5677